MRKLLGIVGLLLATAAPVLAAVPTTFSVQGVLRDSTGKLQSMSVSVTATMWDAQTMGNQLAGPYVQNNIMATNGLFTVAITDANIVTKLSATTTGQVWIELTVGNDTFPRQLVTPGVYALMSANADHAASADSATNATNATNATTATNATQLGGVAASGYQAATAKACGSGSFLQTIAANGTTTCAAGNAGTVTSVAAGTGLTGGTITGAGTLSVVFGGGGSSGAAAHADHVHGLACITQSSPGVAGVACPGGYTMIAGGCTCDAAAQLVDSYPSGSTWQCSCNSGATTAYARCCTILAP